MTWDCILLGGGVALAAAGAGMGIVALWTMRRACRDLEEALLASQSQNPGVVREFVRPPRPYVPPDRTPPQEVEERKTGVIISHGE